MSAAGALMDLVTVCFVGDVIGTVCHYPLADGFGCLVARNETGKREYGLVMSVAPTGDSTSLDGGEYVSSTGVLPGRVASTVGYDARGQTVQLHRGLPSPYLTFIFSLHDPIVSGQSAAEAFGAQAGRNDIIIAGLHTSATYVVQPTAQSGIQMAVHPLAARALFGMPASALAGVVAEGVDVLGNAVASIRGQIEEKGSWSGRFDILARYLRARIVGKREAGEPRPELAEAWSRLARYHGTSTIDRLSSHVGLSPRQLTALFDREVGLSPKKVGRLMRFDHARSHIAAAIAAGEELNLTDTAVLCGYYDHPHLIREFREFAGVPPTEWLFEERRNIQAGGHRHGEWCQT